MVMFLIIFKHCLFTGELSILAYHNHKYYYFTALSPLSLLVTHENRTIRSPANVDYRKQMERNP